MGSLKMLNAIDTVVNSLHAWFGSAEAFLRSRRRHMRHNSVQAEVIIGNRAYSVRDWSMGGVAFDTTPDARLMNGDYVQLVIKFRLPHDTITVQQRVQVVRTARRGVAAKFNGMTAEVRRQFERVLDNLHAQTFMESQIA